MLFDLAVYSTCPSQAREFVVFKEKLYSFQCTCLELFGDLHSLSSLYSRTEQPVLITMLRSAISLVQIKPSRHNQFMRYFSCFIHLGSKFIYRDEHCSTLREVDEAQARKLKLIFPPELVGFVDLLQDNFVHLARLFR